MVEIVDILNLDQQNLYFEISKVYDIVLQIYIYIYGLENQSLLQTHIFFSQNYIFEVFSKICSIV